jgi:hypothetical protein
MKPVWHFITSTILFIILYPFFGVLSLLVYIGGWLIDWDHMIYYAVKFRSLNYFKANKYFRELKPSGKKVINIFHTIEVWSLMLILSFFNTYALIITLGLALHIILDFISLAAAKKTEVRYHTITGWVIDVIKSRKKQAL